MVDFCSEQNLGRHHGVFIGQEELCVEQATFEWGLGGTSDLDDEVTSVVWVGFSVDADDWLLHETLGLLHNAWVSHINLIIF